MMKNVNVSYFGSLKWETLTRRLCTLIELKHCFLEYKELTTDLTHDRQLLFSQKYVMVIHVRVR